MNTIKFIYLKSLMIFMVLITVNVSAQTLENANNGGSEIVKDGAYSKEAISVSTPEFTYNAKIQNAAATGPKDPTFTLVNADTDLDVGTIDDGDTIVVLPGQNFTIRAYHNPPDVGCVRFLLDGREIVENFDPYAIFGDTDADFHDSVLIHGHHTLIAIPYPENNMVGTPGKPDTLNFFVKSLGDIVSYTLVNADTDEDICPINNNDTFNIAAFPTRNLNIRANGNEFAIGSVLFNLDGLKHKENTQPFAFFGDVNGNYNKGGLALGSHTLTGTPYTRFNGTGTMGIPFTVNFVIIDTTSTLGFGPDVPKIPSKEYNGEFSIYPNPSAGQLTISFTMDHTSLVYMQVFDMKGIEIESRCEGEMKSGNQCMIQLEEGELPPGTYLIRLYTEEKLIAQEKFGLFK